MVVEANLPPKLGLLNELNLLKNIPSNVLKSSFNSSTLVVKYLILFESHKSQTIRDVTNQFVPNWNDTLNFIIF